MLLVTKQKEGIKRVRKINKEHCVDIKCLSFEWHSEIDKKVDVNRSQNVLDRLLCCLRKVSTAIVLNRKIVNVTFAIINHGGNKMTKRIDISNQTDEIIRRTGMMGETYDDVIQRVFSTAYVCDFCCNQE